MSQKEIFSCHCAYVTQICKSTLSRLRLSSHLGAQAGYAGRREASSSFRNGELNPRACSIGDSACQIHCCAFPLVILDVCKLCVLQFLRRDQQSALLR